MAFVATGVIDALQTHSCFHCHSSSIAIIQCDFIWFYIALTIFYWNHILTCIFKIAANALHTFFQQSSSYIKWLPKSTPIYHTVFFKNNIFNFNIKQLHTVCPAELILKQIKSIFTDQLSLLTTPYFFKDGLHSKVIIS